MLGGLLLAFTEISGKFVGPLMDDRLTFLTQRDLAGPETLKAMYISGSMVGVNPRIETERHPRCIVPKQNVARRVLCWARRYPGVGILMCKRDVRGALTYYLWPWRATPYGLSLRPVRGQISRDVFRLGIHTCQMESFVDSTYAVRLVGFYRNPRCFQRTPR